VVNPVTNKIYVANYEGDSTVTVIDGVTNVPTRVICGWGPYGLAVDPVTNKVFVANGGGTTVTVIDGATNSTSTVAAGNSPSVPGVNPVTGKVYVPNWYDNSVTVITEAPYNDTKVQATVTTPAGDTVHGYQPVIAGKGVCRWVPPTGHDSLIGVYTHINTAQQGWTAATLSPTGRPDSVLWLYSWVGDSLNWGENFVCVLPLEADGATTNNMGLGTPFGGNVLVYPVYRFQTLGIEESRGTDRPEVLSLSIGPNPVVGASRIRYGLPKPAAVRLSVYSTLGALVRTLASGPEEAGYHQASWDGRDGRGREVGAGVYLLRMEAGSLMATRKLVVQR